MAIEMWKYKKRLFTVPKGTLKGTNAEYEGDCSHDMTVTDESPVPWCSPLLHSHSAVKTWVANYLG